MIAPLKKTLQLIELQPGASTSGTIEDALWVSFRMLTGTATIGASTVIDAAGTTGAVGINFDQLNGGNIYPDIAYSVDAASSMQIIGVRFV